MHAFHGNAELKREIKERLFQHQEKGQILPQTRTWKESAGIGSPVGCAIHAADVAAYERQLGIPQALADLMETAFSINAHSATQLQQFAPGWLPVAEAEKSKIFPVAWIEAITPGADLSRVPCQFVERLLIDPGLGAVREAQDKRVTDLLRGVAAPHHAMLEGRPPGDKTWEELRGRALALRDTWPKSSDSLDAWAAGVAETACWPCTPESGYVAVETFDTYAACAYIKAMLATGWTHEDRKRTAEFDKERNRLFDEAIPQAIRKTLSQEEFKERIDKAMAPLEERAKVEYERAMPWQIEALKQRWQLSGACEQLLVDLVTAAKPAN